MQSQMNLRIKFRESFRPFAPCVLAEEVSHYFDLDRESPYMLMVADVKKDLWCELTPEQHALMMDADLRICVSGAAPIAVAAGQRHTCARMAETVVPQ